MTTIVVSAANSDISLSIARIIRLCVKDVTLVGVSPDGCVPSYAYYDHVEPIPMATQGEIYTKALSNILQKHNADIFYPSSESEISLFSLSNFKPIQNIIINNMDIVEKCLDKFQTYTWLKSIKVPVPDSWIFSEEKASIPYPVIIKKRSSAGSKNIYYAENYSFYDLIYKENKERASQYIVQRLIADEAHEYTCAIWRFNNDLRTITFKRVLYGGFTGEATVAEIPEVQEILHKIADNISGNFFINVQLRIEDNIPYVFEINPRFSSTLMIRHKIGFQDFLWTLFYYLGKEIPDYRPPLKDTKVYRMSEELVVPALRNTQNLR
jgi:carbamoyl-phosphate synthase large subunit